MIPNEILIALFGFICYMLGMTIGCVGQKELEKLDKRDITRKVNQTFKGN